MKNIQLTEKKRGCEVLVMTLTAETEDGRKLSKDINMGGNATGAVRYGALLVVQALEEMEKQNV